MKRSLLLLSLVLATGCAKKGGSNNESSQGLALASTSTFMGETFQVCAANGGSLRDLSWIIKDESGFDITDMCQPAGGGRCMECVFDSAGEYSAQLNAVNQDGAAVSFSANFTVLDPALKPDQPPIIVFKVKKSDGSVVTKLSTSKNLEQGTTNFPTGTYALDISESSDDKDPFNTLKFEMKIGSGSFQPVPPSYSFPVGAKPVTVRATDAQGNVREKTFILYVSCSGPNNLAVSNVQAVHKSGNVFHFSASVTGGSGPKKVLMDLNGDGALDGDFFDAAGGADRYVDFAGTRNIKVVGWDTQCNFQKEVTVSMNLPTPRLQHDGNIYTVNQVKDFGNGDNYFIQADLQGGGGAPHANGQYIAASKEYAPGSNDDIVRCNKSGGEFTIESLVAYKRNGVLGRRHGMELHFSGLPDEGQGGSLDRAIYRSDEQPDGTLVAQTYQQDGCDAQVKVEKDTAEIPCDGGVMVESRVYRIFGKFSCGNMSSGSGNMSAKFGAFYCEQAERDSCPGGPGGGGGGEPPPAL